MNLVQEIVEMNIKHPAGCLLCSVTVDRSPESPKICLLFVLALCLPYFDGLWTSDYLKLSVHVLYQSVCNTRTLGSIALQTLGYLKHAAYFSKQTVVQV